MRTLLACLALVLIGSAASAAVVAGGNGANGGLGNGNNGNNNNNNNGVNAPPSLVGQTFDIAINDGTKSTLHRLSFRTKDVACDFFDKWGISAVPFTEEPGKSKSVSFKGELTDKAGNSLSISGQAKDDGSISGDIEIAKKDGADKQSYQFSGGVPGSEGSKAAKKEVEESKSKKPKK